MSGVSTFRLYVLRATYLFIVVGLAFLIWPGLLRPSLEASHMNTVVHAMLGAVSILAAVGIRHPLAMLPVLFFELAWKALWLIVYARPLRAANALGPDAADTMMNCILGVVVVLVAVPWGYVFRRYVTGAGERWGRRAEEPRGVGTAGS